jgi:CHAT domain-containing protein
LWSMRYLLTNTSDELKNELFKAWLETLEETTQWLWDRVIRKLIPMLKEHGESAVLIPAGQLALLPLHAAWIKEPSKPSKRLYALDELNLSYAPSAHSLRLASLAAQKPAESESLLIIDNPDGSLKFVKDQVQAAIEGFKQVKHLSGKRATLITVKKEMQRAYVLHFATHGRAGWEKAEQAQLLLADGILTLPDIFKLDLKRVRLAILSACETGVPGLELIDEMIGLPSGMLQAGVPGVIGSLWPVDDASTAMLITRFYQYWRKEGKTPQEALKQAQSWLRDSLYESPYYWAAFTYNGV